VSKYQVVVKEVTSVIWRDVHKAAEELTGWFLHYDVRSTPWVQSEFRSS
jgi:hypothetical protein